MNNWFQQHQDRYAVIVAEYDNEVIGWASTLTRNDVLMTVLPTYPYTLIELLGARGWKHSSGASREIAKEKTFIKSCCSPFL